LIFSKCSALVFVKETQQPLSDHRLQRSDNRILCIVETMACKNSINWQVAVYTGVFRVLAFHSMPQLYVFAGAVSRKRHKILVEVRLIVKVRLMRNFCQINCLSTVYQVKNVRKTVEARDFLRRDAHESLELRAQVVLANANLIAQGPNRQRAVPLGNLADGTLHQIQAPGRITESSEQ
jgi:hypothetical protein